jgi:hypothetical protein
MVDINDKNGWQYTTKLVARQKWLKEPKIAGTYKIT